MPSTNNQIHSVLNPTQSHGNYILHFGELVANLYESADTPLTPSYFFPQKLSVRVYIKSAPHKIVILLSSCKIGLVKPFTKKGHADFLSG